MIYLMNRGPSTLYSNLLRRNANAEMQTQLATAEQELSSGVKSDIYKSLGTGAAEALNLNVALERDEAQRAANSLLGSRLDTMSQALGTMREAVQSTLELALANAASDGGTADGLQTSARAALDMVIAQANLNYGGQPMFAGIADGTTALQAWDRARADTGLSPQGVIDEVIAQGMAAPADVADRIAELDAIFANSAADPDENFDSLFFTGSTGSARMSASIGDGEMLSYGVQANDAAFRQVLQGLSMLAATDPTAIPDGEAYAAWLGTATERLNAGLSGLLDSQTQLDTASVRIETANTRMEDRAPLYKGRIFDLVGVDEYEAATRITALDARLQASYAATSRLSQLSFLNFMF